MLRIHDVIIELVRELAPVAAEIARHDTDLARQLRKALSGVPLNVAEGSNQRGKRRGFPRKLPVSSPSAGRFRASPKKSAPRKRRNLTVAGGAGARDLPILALVNSSSWRAGNCPRR